MDVLEAALGVVAGRDAQESRAYFSFQAAGRSPTGQVAAEQVLLELEADDDVQVVRRLVGLHADQATARRWLTAKWNASSVTSCERRRERSRCAIGNQ